MTNDYSISKMFSKKTSLTPSKKSIGWIENDELHFLTNQEYYNQVEILSHGLVALGLKSQETLAILAQSSKEWHLMDLAGLCSRIIVTPIYPTYTAHEIEYIINHSESKIIFIDEASQFDKLIEIQESLKGVKGIISMVEIDFETKAKFNSKITFTTYSQLLELGKKSLTKNPSAFKNLTEASLPEDIASIIYTSGTTGDPKGAVITHHAFCSMLYNVKATLSIHITPQDRTLTFLPLSHVFGRCDSMLGLIFDLEQIYAQSLDKVVDNLAIAKPTIMLAVPRIFEKVYARVLENIAKENKIKKTIFEWALSASKDYFDKINNDKSPSSLEIIQRNLAYKLVFNKIYEKFGGRIRFLVSGGAPLAPEIINFLQNANLTILEGYGLTETVAPCILNPIARQIPGTIGLPLGDVKVKFALDGEILLKTDALFSYYLKNEEATKSAFDDGWFLTGDIGELTAEGYIKITDRKKDLIITSAGKNVAPQKIENSLKLQKHISNAMVVGDKRKFLVAVISLDRESFLDELNSLGLDNSATYHDLATSLQVREIISHEIDATNKELARFESIKGFIIASDDFSIENGQITPSLKLKKKVILNTYAKEIDSLYNDLESKHS